MLFIPLFFVLMYFMSHHLQIQKAMSRAVAEAQLWKSKFDTEAVARIDDLENARSKLLVSCAMSKQIEKSFISEAMGDNDPTFLPVSLEFLAQNSGSVGQQSSSSNISKTFFFLLLL